jgi:hypothetical protein
MQLALGIEALLQLHHVEPPVGQADKAVQGSVGAFNLGLVGWRVGADEAVLHAQADQPERQSAGRRVARLASQTGFVVGLQGVGERLRAGKCTPNDLALLFPPQPPATHSSGDVKRLSGEDGCADRITNGTDAGAMVIGERNGFLAIELPAVMACGRCGWRGWWGQAWACGRNHLWAGGLEQHGQPRATGQ